MFGGCFFQAKIPAGAGSNCDNIRFMEQGSTIGLLSAQLSPARSEVKDDIASVKEQSNNCLFHFFQAHPVNFNFNMRSRNCLFADKISSHFGL